MPKKVEDCVASLMAKWKANPRSRPVPKEKGQDAKSQAWAICQSAQGKRKAETWQQLITLSQDGFGPTMLGAALTNRPHLKGLPPVSLVERNGSQMLRVPLVLLGKWRHPRGVLDLTSATIDSFRRNFEANVVGHEISLDNRHMPELGANGWFKEVTLESDRAKALMVVYAEPTPEGRRAVEEKRYRYASLEFALDFVHPMMESERLSTDEIICEYDEEEDMAEELEQVIGEIEETAGDERVRQLEAQLETAQQEAAKGLQLAQRLEQERQDRLTLEARLAAIERERDRANVEKILLQAQSFRDGDGRAHSKPLLDWAARVLLGEKIVVSVAKDGAPEQAILLEESAGESGIHRYYREAIQWLLQHAPGVVPLKQAGVERDESRSLEAGESEITDAQATEFWGQPVKRAGEEE